MASWYCGQVVERDSSQVAVAVKPCLDTRRGAAMDEPEMATTFITMRSSSATPSRCPRRSQEATARIMRARLKVGGNRRDLMRAPRPRTRRGPEIAAARLAEPFVAWMYRPNFVEYKQHV